MLATATILEIDNRFIGQRWKIILPIPRALVLHRLRKCLTETDPESGELVFIDRDPMGCAPYDAHVSIDPWGGICLVIYPAGDTGTADGPRAVPLGSFALELLNERSGFLKGRAGE